MSPESDHIYKKLDKLDDHLLKITEQTARIEEILTNTSKQSESSAEKVYALEKNQEKQKGVMIAITAIFGVVINLAIAYAKYRLLKQ